jgi:hypothetical protein
MTEPVRQPPRSRVAGWLVAAAVLCWVVAGFGLFQLALIAGSENVEAVFGQSTGTPLGIYVAGVAGSLALAFAFVVCTVMAGRRSRAAARTPYLLAGGGLMTLGLMVGAMTAQQLTLTGTMADAANVGGSTSFAQGLVTVAAALLFVGALATGLAGLLRRPSA